MSECSVIVLTEPGTEVIESPVQTVIELAPTVQVVEVAGTTSIEIIEVNTAIEIVQPPLLEVPHACLVGPEGPKGLDGTAAEQINVSVLVGQTVVVDSLGAGVYPSCKWIITAIDTVTTKRKISEVLAIHNGSVAKHTHYGMAGDVIPYSISVTVPGGISFQLELTNNHTEDLDIKALRLSTTF